MRFRLLLLLTLLLAGCVPTTPTETDPHVPSGDEGPADELPTPTETLTLEPVEPDAPIPTPTETPTPTPTATPFVCAKLFSPENGLELPAVGKVTFAWEPVEGADSYLLNFTLPNGTLVTFETDETTKDRYMEAFGMSGAFEWNVAAFDVYGNKICASVPFSFKKSASTKNSNSGDGGQAPEEPPPSGNE